MGTRNFRIKNKGSEAGFSSLVLSKFNGLVGYIIILVFSIGIAYVVSRNYILGGGIVAMLFSACTLFICYKNSYYGFVINFIFSFFGFHLTRILFSVGISLPTGIVSDTLIYVTFIGLFKGNVSIRTMINSFLKNPVVVYLLIIYGYFAIQVFNPNAFSFDGWFQGFRKVFSALLLLFISYSVFIDFVTIKRFINLFFVGAAFVGLYGCIQEWFGLFDFEIDWLYSDPHGVGLAFIDGDLQLQCWE